MLNRYLLLWLALLLGAVSTGRAQRVVQGAVQGHRDGTALPGVTVLVKGTAIGTSTTMQGSFRLVVPRDTVTLQFSSVGFVDVEKKLRITSDTTQLEPVRIKEACNIDYFYSRHIELSVASGVRYAPLGGKIKVFYPYLLPVRRGSGSMRVEFGYQAGNQNYQRNATLALDNIFEDCENDITVTADYQRVWLGEQAFSFTRYSLAATYTRKEINSAFPGYIAVGQLRYVRDGKERPATGLEIGVDYPLYIRRGPQLVLSGRIAWWQEYWQFWGGVEAEYRRFTTGVNFNQLGPYTELNSRVGFKLQRRYHAKKT